MRMILVMINLVIIMIIMTMALFDANADNDHVDDRNDDTSI